MEDEGLKYINLFLKPEILDVLEEILEKDSRDLCSPAEFVNLSKHNEKFNQSELEEMLHEAKDFIEPRLKINCSKPIIDYFSIFDYSPEASYVQRNYLFSMFIGLGSVLLLNSSPLALSVGLGASAFSLYEGYKSKKIANQESFYYNGYSKKITVSPRSKFEIGSSIAHEYVHHALAHIGLASHYLDEGFARGLEIEFSKHLSEKNNDERYTYVSRMRGFTNMLDIYNIGRHNQYFQGVFPNKAKLKMTSMMYHGYGYSLIRILNEFGVIDYKDCNPIEILGKIKELI